MEKTSCIENYEIKENLNTVSHISNVTPTALKKIAVIKNSERGFFMQH